MDRTLNAYAKINISLDIVAKLPSGFHSMKMIMQSVELHDTVTLRTNDTGQMTVKTNLRYLPRDDGNIALRAAKVFFEHCGITGQGIDITINKQIPVGAGMGGGSADGAAVLRGMNEIYAAGLSGGELETIGMKVGSDVPFCVQGGTALVTGRGEILESLTPMPQCPVVICKPPFSVSTAELFSKVHCEKIRQRPDTEGIVNALAVGRLDGVAHRMFNVFEYILPSGAASSIQEIKSRLLDFCALGTVMTGSGSAVFALFDSELDAQSAYSALRPEYEECYITKIIDKYPV